MPHAVAGVVGGIVLEGISWRLTAPVLTQDEAAEEVGRYNYDLKLRLGRGAGMGARKQGDVDTRGSWAALPWVAPGSGGVSVVAAW